MRRHLIPCILVVAAILVAAVALFSLQASALNTIPQWKWVNVPTCGQGSISLGFRAYLSPFPYPGVIGDRLFIEVLNPGTTQTNITLHIYLPSSWKPGSFNDSTTLAHGVTRITVTGVNVPGSAKPGIYYASIVVERICPSGSTWVTIYVPLTLYNPPQPSLVVSQAYWEDGYAYPGIRGEPLILRLANNGSYTVTRLSVVVKLPRGLYVAGTSRGEYIAVENGLNILPGQETALRIPIDVANTTRPGAKTIRLLVNATIEDNGAFLELKKELRLEVPVEQVPFLLHSIVDEGWLGGAAFPGEHDAEIVLSLVNRDVFTITSAYVSIHLPRGVKAHNRTVISLALDNTAIGYGGHLSVQIRADVDKELKPGTYYALVEAVMYGREPSGALGLRRLQLRIPLLVLQESRLNFSILYLGWVDGRAYPGEIGAELRLIARSWMPYPVGNLVARLYIPQLNISRTVVLSQRIGFGDILDTRIKMSIPNNTRPGVYEATIIFYGIVDDNGQEYLGVGEIRASISIDKPAPDTIRVVGAEWSGLAIGEKTFLATPRILVEYWGRDTLESMTITVRVLSNARLPGNLSRATTLYSQVLVSGSAAWIQLPPLRVVDAAKPVELGIEIRATARTSSGGIYPILLYKRVKLPVAVREGPLKMAGIEYVTEHLLPGARGSEIRIRIANTASEPVYVLSVKPLASTRNIDVRVSSTGCLSAPVAPGQACSITLKLSISNTTRPGTYRLQLLIWYSYQVSSGVETGIQEINADIVVEDAGKYMPRLDVEAYWARVPGAEPVSVLPGDIAPLQIVVYNEGPGDAKGVVVEVNASRIGDVLSPSQPCNLVPAGSSCSTTVYLRIKPGLRPGLYRVGIHLSYIFDSYTTYIIVEKDYTVALRVSSENDAIKVVYSFWTTPPYPGTRSAQLAIYIVGDPRLVSEIKTVELVLPPGLFNPNNNSSRVVALPSEEVSQTQLGLVYKKLKEIAILASSTTLPAPLMSKLFVARIGIGQNTSGEYRALAIIYWVDQLGSLRATKYTMALPVVGGSSFIKVLVPGSAELLGGIANVSIGLLNQGNTPLYNVYVTLIPASYVAYPATSTKYIPVLEPGKLYKLNYTLNYNPSSFGSEPSYTFNGVLAVIYETPTGLRGFYNTSISILLRPVIRLELAGLKAVWSNGSLVVEGIISNTGTQQAKTVSIELVAGNKTSFTIIGDIDAGSEAPFRVSLKTGPVESAAIRLIYHDIYGGEYMVTKTIAVSKTASSTLTPREGAKRANSLARLAAPALVLAIILLVALLAVLRKKRGVATP